MEYRADHVGSLLRPPELLAARLQHAAGQLGLAELRELEDACILRALAMQRETGIAVLSDGEYRRASWMEAWSRVLAPFEVADTSGASVTPISAAGEAPVRRFSSVRRGRSHHASSSARRWTSSRPLG